MALEQRVSRLEGAHEQEDSRLSNLQDDMTALRSEMNSRINTLSL